MKQYPIELHCHTNHSDGEFEVEELIEEAVSFGYKGLILTDHNTTSSAEEVIEKGLDQKIAFLKGIEWTTYFGHMLVHDAKRVVDWREATIDTIDDHIKEVKDAEGLVGIAHPYIIGSPICTGCHWEFNVRDWSKVNYIELWNRTNPHKQFWSERAYQLWTGKLKEGYHLAASAGRDWHRPEKDGEVPGITYVQTDESFSPQAMKAALQKGAMYITLAPRMDITLSNKKEQYSLGDTVPSGEYDLRISVLEPDIELFTHLDIEVTCLRVIQNEEVIREITEINQEIEGTLTCENGYIRVEALGRYGNLENVRVLISSPIYIQK